MSYDDEEGAIGSVTTYVPKNVSFVDGSLDLKALLRDLKRHSKAAVEILVKCMQNSNDPKMQLTAAMKLLELQKDVAKDMNEDQLKRLIAQVKFPTGAGLPKLEEEDRPIVDFTTIRE